MQLHNKPVKLMDDKNIDREIVTKYFDVVNEFSAQSPAVPLIAEFIIPEAKKRGLVLNELELLELQEYAANFAEPFPELEEQQFEYVTVEQMMRSGQPSYTDGMS